jgi:multidrug resistance efflux pump
MNAPLNVPPNVSLVTGATTVVQAVPASVPSALIAFADLEDRARQAKTLPELIFTIVNETFGILPYRQAVLWELDSRKATKLRLVSGLTKLGDDSPNSIFLRRLGREISKRLGDDGEYYVGSEFKGALQKEWPEYLPSYLLTFLIKDQWGQPRAIVGFALEDEASEPAQEWVIRLLGAYGHAWGALTGQRRKARSGWWKKPGVWIGLSLLALLALFIPVSLSVLAPTEVIAFDAQAVSAPMDGVIKVFHIQPNQVVKKGDLLITLDDTSLKSRREVAQKQLQVARADSLSAQQRAFTSDQSRGELASLNGRVAEREAEIQTIDEMLTRIDIRAARDGIAVFGDINDWQGKPVVTGERIAQLADPNDTGVLVWLPVADAINLEAGAPFRLYLQVAPLKPLEGKIVQTSYQVNLAPDGVASYRLRGRFENLDAEAKALARVGLKGTAKLYGAKAPLGYYLFRRPLSTLRELTGF